MFYDGNGNIVDIPKMSYPVVNEGAITSPNSFFTKEVSKGYDGFTFIGISAIAYPNTKIGTFMNYVGVWAKATADCTLRLYDSTSYTDAIANAPPQRTSDATMKRENTIAVIENAKADTWYYLYGIHSKTTTTAAAARGFHVSANYGTVEKASGNTLYVKMGVATDLSSFGDKVPDADTIKDMLSSFDDYYFTEADLWNDNALVALSNKYGVRNDSITNNAYLYSDGKQIHAGCAIDENWEGWEQEQNSYGQHPKLTPLPMEVHGKVESDAGFSCVPLYGQWAPYSTTTGNPISPWGGHFFHGWNSAKTFRLTMMAAGGMTAGDVPDFVPREDEFCLHVFSPHNAISQPVNIREWESQHRITPTQEDTFSGGAYYGRLRIGADKADEGFLFQCKRMTAFGLIDMNGKKFILGDQTANVPASSTAAGEKGQIAFDSNYFYVCVAKNTWKRFALETW